MMDADSFVSKIEDRLEEMEDVEDLPPFSEYESLIKGRGFQEELANWSKRLSDETNRYSALKTELIEIKKWRRENLDDLPDQLTGKLADKLNEFEERYKTLVDIVRKRIRTIERLIESVRSLQSHSNPK